MATLDSIGVVGLRDRKRARREAFIPGQQPSWDLDSFAQEQIRGLVRRVFSPNGGAPAQQVVFSAIDSSSDVLRFCRQVGDLLAQEKAADVAIVAACSHPPRCPSTEATAVHHRGDFQTPLKQVATRLRRNCWLLDGGDRFYGPGESLQTYLSQIREEFEYSIVAAPVAGESDVVTAMGQLADGIILVLCAHRTRRAAARKIKERMDDAHVRLLGTVLSEREFPIPHKLYVRL